MTTCPLTPHHSLRNNISLTIFHSNTHKPTKQKKTTPPEPDNMWNYKRVEYFLIQIPQCVNWNKIRHFMQSEYTIWETCNKQVPWFVKCTSCQFHRPFLLVEMSDKEMIMKNKYSTTQISKKRTSKCTIKGTIKTFFDFSPEANLHKLH